MDVTTENFDEALAALKALVPNCDFVSIDLEFTGLDLDVSPEETGPGDESGASPPPEFSSTTGKSSASEDVPRPFDLKQEAQAKYVKMRNATKFLVVQVGVCPFVYNSQKKTFVASPFNFYVFPIEFKGIDRRFMCQTRCMQFLSHNSLDFNKLFKAGVPFLNHEEEEFIRSSGGKDAVFIKATRAALVDFICDASQASIVLPPADGFHRMLIYRELTDVFGGVLRHERPAMNGELSVRVHRTEGTARLGSTRAAVQAAVEERAKTVDEKQMRKAIGFRHVYDLLVAMRKPLVGHNMLLDMMQLESHFWRDLPPHLSAFEASLHARFPCMLDTKHLLAAAPPSLAKHFGFSAGGCRLDIAFRTVSSDPFRKPLVQLEQGFERYNGASRLHEAGYDAYMTGLVYLRLAQHLVISPPQKGLSHAHTDLSHTHTGLTPRLRDMAGSSKRPSSVMLETLRSNGYCNKLHVVGCSRVSYFDFDGEFNREISPLGDWETAGLNSPKRGRPVSQDMDSSIEHEALYCGRGSGVGSSTCKDADAVTPPHTGGCVARYRVREVLDRDANAAKKPHEKRPRMSK